LGTVKISAFLQCVMHEVSFRASEDPHPSKMSE